MSDSSPLPGLPGSRSGISYPYPAAFILFKDMGENVVCPTSCPLDCDGIRYDLQGYIPYWESKELWPLWSRCYCLYRSTNDPTSPVGRETKVHVNHCSTYIPYSVVFFIIFV